MDVDDREVSTGSTGSQPRANRRPLDVNSVGRTSRATTAAPLAVVYPTVTAGNEYRSRPLLLPEPFDESGSSVDLDKEQRTMRAVGFSEFGGPEVMKVLSLPEPIPGPGEVRIRVAAVDINPSDALARSGRLVETGPKRFPLSESYVVGWNVAGVIDSVGSINGSNLRVGDSVYRAGLAPIDRRSSSRVRSSTS